MAGATIKYNILYIASLPPGGTCLQRMQALEELGHKVVPLSTQDQKQYSLYQRIRTRIFGPADLTGVNRRILTAINKEAFDLIWIDKGIYIFPDTLKEIKRITQSILIHHSTDDFKYVSYSFRHYIRSIPYYDIHFTSNNYNIPELYESGAKKVCFLELGYDHKLYRPVKLASDDYKADLFFIGHWEPTTEDHIVALVKAGLPVSVRGAGWHKAKNKKVIKSIYRSGPVWEEEYVKALCSGKIGLGIVSKWNRNMTAGRIFEMPACGVFLLAVRNPVIQALYQEGVEAEYFSSAEELVQKARYYLEHDEERRKIALAGHRRCINSKYSWKDRVEEMLAEINGLVQAKN
jgi:spore maturation protein CgeB